MPAAQDPQSSPDQAKDMAVRFCFEKDDGATGRRTLLVRDRPLYAEAQRWTYVLAHRERLAGEALTDALTKSASAAQVSLLRLQTMLSELADRELVEVSVPLAGATTQGEGYGARLFPWELVISLLTAEQRRAGERLNVVRQLEGALASKAPLQPPGNAGNLLFASVVPGRRAGRPDFEGEAAMVAHAFGADPAACALENPSLAELTRAVRERRPEFVHLTGYDGSMIADEDLSLASPFRPGKDGKPGPVRIKDANGGDCSRRDCFALRGDNGRLHLATPDEMAEALYPPGGNAPRFVAINSYYSARRLAPRLVAAGAQAVVGFFDTVTDASAEAFFAAFYHHWAKDRWRHPAWIISDALQDARRDPEVHLSGGACLWSARSCFPLDRTRRRGRAAVAPSKAKAAPRRPVEIPAASIPQAVSLTIMPEESVNYACLHNGRPLFREFRVRKLLPGKLPPLEVKVQLDVGAVSAPVRFTVRLKDDALAVPLTGQVCTPLHAALLRRAGEDVRSALYVRVRCGGHTLEEWTRPVTILSADEWRDDGQDLVWLPSFVLPRDPAVLRILASAVRYLRAVADEPSAGFSGYQGQQFPSPEADEQEVRAIWERNQAVVDNQVRAVWLALQHDFRLTYYNPPPTYTARSQRLRSPTQILGAAGATCIDLALLFCACLEYIGIAPALFLIRGHAFPGYWRGENAHAQLSSGGQWLNSAGGATAVDAAAAPPPWVLDLTQFGEVRSYVDDGLLVPFESTFVTGAHSFASARVAGLDRLRPETFEAMLDIGLARGRNVTPIALSEA